MKNTSIFPNHVSETLIFNKDTGWRENMPAYIEPGTRVLCLYRVSTDKQLYHTDNNEADIPMQRKRCRKYCESMDWTIVCELQEEGVSGHKVRAENRDKIQLIKEYAKQKKTRFVVKPNLYLANTSYIVTDPKSEVLRSVGALLLQKGYTLRVLDLIDPEHSDCYNPFQYIRKDSDVFRLIDNFIKNTTPKKAANSDPFWEKSETALDSALMLYLLHEAPPEEQNMEMILTMIEYGSAKEDDDDFQSPLDLLFEALEEEQPEHIAVRQYKIFKQAAGDICSKRLVNSLIFR